MQGNQERPGTPRGATGTKGPGEHASPPQTTGISCGGKITDSHHHVYDSRYPIDPAAQLRPAGATVADYRALRRRVGLRGDGVVQPSTYGTDNRCLLDALSQFRADARGIAAVADTMTDSEL